MQQKIQIKQLNNKAFYCLTCQEVEGSISGLVKYVAQQCLWVPASFPLPPLPTSTCPSQVNSSHGSKITVTDAPWRHNVLLLKGNGLFPNISFKSKDKLSHWPLRTCYQVLGQNLVMRPCLNQSLMRRLPLLLWLIPILIHSLELLENTWREKTSTQLEFCLWTRKSEQLSFWMPEQCPKRHISRPYFSSL